MAPKSMCASGYTKIGYEVHTDYLKIYKNIFFKYFIGDGNVHRDLRSIKLEKKYSKY